MGRQFRPGRHAGAAIIALAAIAAAPSAIANPAPGPVVQTPLGFVQGTTSPTVGAPVQAFLGLRYGDSPSGDLRWAPPQFTGAYGTKNEPTLATTPPVSCPQAPGEFADPNPAVTSGNGSENNNPVTLDLPGTEDCLFLNVWRPATATANSKLPIFFWIHGGALTTGASSGFDPSVMVKNNNIIVVTTNYRLASLGWLAEVALAAPGPDAFENVGDAGNYGLMDQQFAMQWVQANIASFGGDPRKVTIGGESAGGLSTSLNLESTVTGRGLFRGAIIESGAYMINTVAPLATSENSGLTVAKRILASTNGNSPQSLPGPVACNSLTTPEFNALTATQVAACLRLQSIETILQLGAGGAPTSGTKIVPQGLKQAFSTGEFNRVPVLQGTNHDEGRLFINLDNFFDGNGANPSVFVPGGPAEALILADEVTFKQELTGVVGGGLATVLTSTPLPPTVTAPYNPADFPNPDFHNAPSADAALGAAFTDEVFACNGLESNNFLRNFVPVYAYEFHDPNAPNLFQPLVGFSYGSSHASELQYLFDASTLQGPFDAAANQAVTVPSGDGPSNAVQPPPLTPGGAVLATEMKASWANFVKNLTPNGINAPLWVPYNASGSVSWIQQLTPTFSLALNATTFSNEHNCAFWGPILNPPPPEE